MSTNSVWAVPADKGYRLLPRAHPNSPGYTGLVFVLGSEASRKHFNPAKARIHLQDEFDICRWTTLTEHTIIKGDQHICPGRLTLFDPDEAVRDFFTFGGWLRPSRVPPGSMYVVASTAPVLELNNPRESVPDQLAAEADALLARIVVRCEPERDSFDERLSKIDPFQFYAATLNSILTHYQNAPILEKSFRGFYDALAREKGWLASNGLWPDKLLPIEEIC